jgi:hypothetical protein
MELALEPELYSPSIDNNGNYIDSVPPSNTMKNGIKCPCGGSRKNIAFTKTSDFTKHTKTITHQKWLENINNNKSNLYVECYTLRKTIETQKLIIAEKEKMINSKEMIINCLTDQLEREKNKGCKTENLLDLLCD